MAASSNTLLIPQQINFCLMPCNSTMFIYFLSAVTNLLKCVLTVFIVLFHAWAYFSVFTLPLFQVVWPKKDK